MTDSAYRDSPQVAGHKPVAMDHSGVPMDVHRHRHCQQAHRDHTAEDRGIDKRVGDYLRWWRKKMKPLQVQTTRATKPVARKLLGAIVGIHRSLRLPIHLRRNL
jgi:hypothetical protein